MTEEMEIITRICVGCLCEFEISISEQQWFRSKNFLLPRHCHACRVKRRQAANAQTPSDVKGSL